MKKQIGLFTAILFAVSTLMMVCKAEVHTHTFSEEWKTNKNFHWKECTRCKETLESAVHEYEWTVTKEATCTEEGSKTGVCEVCKKEVTEKIDAKGHSGIWETTKVPTETESGGMKIVCEVCGETVTKELQPLPNGFVFVKGTTIIGEESWTPSSDVFVSGRKLTIPDLIVSDHEVTRGEYKAVMGSDPSTIGAYDKEGNKLTGDAKLNNPVNYVSWYDALVYCNKLSMQENLTSCYSIRGSTDPVVWGAMPADSWDLAICDFEANGYRLPTEAEWEWLARGGENYKYAGSDNVDDVAWYVINTNDTGTREVKTKAPNGYGLYDMSGNVWEWCWDKYGSISSSSAADGATFGNLFRVLRGGSWSDFDYGCQVAVRSGEFLFERAPGFDDILWLGPSYGFRVVRLAN